MSKTHCRNGHELAVAGRQANGRCKACRKEQSAKYYKENPPVVDRDKKRERAKDYWRRKNGHVLRVKLSPVVHAACLKMGREWVERTLLQQGVSEGVITA